MGLSDFATQDTKIRLLPCAAAVNGRRTRNYIYNENPKQIRKSELTTFEALFMQNAKHIIVEKVTKTASKHQF